MDKITFIRKNNLSDEWELACDDCIFCDICPQTEYNIPGLDCGRGDYWEIVE